MSTPFDMVMMNDLDRFHLVMDIIDRVPTPGSSAALLRQQMVDARAKARRYTREHGDDIPSVRDWTWSNAVASWEAPLADTSTDHTPEVESAKS